jgi:formylglycine-generating enzyme required for sulfatase activity
MAFCDWLGKETGKPYRLPSEAEWEYACRAGTTTPFSFGKTITSREANYDSYFWPGNNLLWNTFWNQFFDAKSTGHATDNVGRFPANPWGLHQMHGNVWEWVEDVWHDSYSGAPVDGTAWTDGEGLLSYHSRVVRGGSWILSSEFCRSALRFFVEPDLRNYDQGFRLARTLS